MGWPEVVENGRKSQEQSVDQGVHCRRFAGPIPTRPAAVGHEILPAAASGCPLPPWPACVAGGWLEVPPSVQSSTTHRWLNGSTCVPGLESFCLGFWELKSCFEG